jgi:hypothetical protein
MRAPIALDGWPKVHPQTKIAGREVVGRQSSKSGILGSPAGPSELAVSAENGGKHEQEAERDRPRGDAIRSGPYNLGYGPPRALAGVVG